MIAFIPVTLIILYFVLGAVANFLKSKYYHQGLVLDVHEKVSFRLVREAEAIPENEPFLSKLSLLKTLHLIGVCVFFAAIIMGIVTLFMN